MIDIENLYKPVAKGMKSYVGCPVIRGEQNQEPPAFPYISYKIITPAGTNKGTYGIYDDGKARKQNTTIFSFTSLSDNDLEALQKAQKAREWLDFAGTLYLKSNDVVVESVGSVGNRTNVLEAEYQYKYGFDCTFSVLDVVDIPEAGAIESVDFGDGVISRQ